MLACPLPRAQFSSLSSASLARACPWTPVPTQPPHPPPPLLGLPEASASPPPGPRVRGLEVPEHRRLLQLQGRPQLRCHPAPATSPGRAGTPYQRILLPKYAASSLDLPRRRAGDGRELPGARCSSMAPPSTRVVSNMMAKAIARTDSHNSLLLMQMGQFIDHDLTHTPNYAEQTCCTSRGATSPSLHPPPPLLPSQELSLGLSTPRSVSRCGCPGTTPSGRAGEAAARRPPAAQHHLHGVLEVPGLPRPRLPAPAQGAAQPGGGGGVGGRAGDPLAGRLQHLRVHRGGGPGAEGSWRQVGRPPPPRCPGSRCRGWTTCQAAGVRDTIGFGLNLSKLF